MARTKAENYDSKRKSITLKAAKLFAAKGFSGTSVSDITKACGVSKSLIYHYYSAKEDILFEVMIDHIDDLVAVTTDLSLEDADPVTEFHNLTHALLRCYAGAENAQKVLLYDLNNLTPKQYKNIVSKQRAIIDRFEQVYIRVHPGIADNHALLRSKVMLFFGSINWIHNWYNPKGEISWETLANLAVTNVINP